MFGIFKRKSERPDVERRPRGILPTYVTKDVVVLSKVAPIVRNTYEIRLALYMATSKGLKFVLAVRPQASVDAAVIALLEQHGGQVQEGQLDDHSVYLGYRKANGEEDGWVLGNSAAMSVLVQSLRSEWLRERLRVGAGFSGDDLTALENTLRNENFSQQNIDGESVQAALLALVVAAKEGG